MSISFLEVLERSLTGPIISERDFDIKVLFPKINEVIKEYDIKYDSEVVVPSDDDLADRVFEAAVELYSQVGTYCKDTERIIKFDEEEIKRGIREAPKKAFFGEGKEAKVFLPRKPEDSNPPWCHVGAGIAVTSEDLFLKQVEARARIPQADSISIPALLSINGIPISGPPLEMYGAIRTITLAHEAFRAAGRPGLPILNLISTVPSQIAGIAASDREFRLKPSDGWLVPTLPELKVYNDSLTKNAYLLSIGANIGSEYGPMIGGLSGGPEGTAVMIVANCIQGIMVQKANYHLCFPTDILYVCSTTKRALWASNVASQAIARNIKVPFIYLSYQASGPATEMLFYEIAASMLSAVSSGVAIETAHPCKAALNDYITPLETEFSVEVAVAASGMKRNDADELVKILLKKYEKDLPNAPIGKKYQECYDVKTGKVKPEYLDLYNRIRKELEDLGLKIA